jgi:hypothetical protein
MFLGGYCSPIIVKLFVLLGFKMLIPFHMGFSCFSNQLN